MRQKATVEPPLETARCDDHDDENDDRAENRRRRERKSGDLESEEGGGEGADHILRLDAPGREKGHHGYHDHDQAREPGKDHTDLADRVGLQADRLPHEATDPRLHRKAVGNRLVRKTQQQHEAHQHRRREDDLQRGEASEGHEAGERAITVSARPPR